MPENFSEAKRKYKKGELEILGRYYGIKISSKKFTCPGESPTAKDVYEKKAVNISHACYITCYGTKGLRSIYGIIQPCMKKF